MSKCLMEKFNGLLNKFNEKKTSHPELATLWINYLEIKLQHMNDVLIHGHNTINSMDTMSDFSPETIQLLYILQSQINIT